MEEFLNKRNIRIATGIIIVTPLTAVTLYYSYILLLFTYIGISYEEPFWYPLGLLAVLGLTGMAGWWRRLLKPTSKRNRNELNSIRVMLFCGLASSLVFLLIIYVQDATEFLVIILPMALINLLFIYTTPDKTNE